MFSFWDLDLGHGIFGGRRKNKREFLGPRPSGLAAFGAPALRAPNIRAPTLQAPTHLAPLLSGTLLGPTFPERMFFFMCVCVLFFFFFPMFTVFHVVLHLPLFFVFFWVSRGLFFWGGWRGGISLHKKHVFHVPFIFLYFQCFSSFFHCSYVFFKLGGGLVFCFQCFLVSRFRRCVTSPLCTVLCATVCSVHTVLLRVPTCLSLFMSLLERSEPCVSCQCRHVSLFHILDGVHRSTGVSTLRGCLARRSRMQLDSWSVFLICHTRARTECARTV